MSPRTRRLALGLPLIAALLLTWWLADLARRAYIKKFFVDGAVAGSDPDLPSAAAPPLAPVDRVRVVLLDGLSEGHADTLPRLTTICAQGQPLRLDVGFPTVSLPIQHVLWTGLTQQQSGIQYHIGKLASPPPHAVPRHVPSRGVAESHPEILHSFGFAAADPPITDVPDPTWPDRFPAAAAAAIASDARLAFVHVLRIDDAGHKTGGASPEYAAAATWSDDLLATLWSTAPADEHTRWFILADHGHRPAGGHGDGEPEIRQVRACVVGGGVPRGPSRPLHLVDLARAVADSLAVPLDPAARGRPWSAALESSAANATLPTAGWPRTVLAAALALSGLLALGPVRAQARIDLLLAVGLALWPLLAWAGLVLQHGAPTLSNPVVFPPQGRDMLTAAAPAMLVLAALVVLAARRGWSSPRIVRTSMVPWLALTAAALLLARVPELLIRGLPPLMPRWTAAASVALAQGRLACLVLAAILSLRLILRTIRPIDERV